MGPKNLTKDSMAEAALDPRSLGQSSSHFDDLKKQERNNSDKVPTELIWNFKTLGGWVGYNMVPLW